MSEGPRVAVDEDKDESVVRDWLSLLSRQRWIVLLAVIVVPLLAFALSQSQQRQYQASAKVLVNEQNPTAAALNLTTGVTSPPDRYAATQAALARVATVAQMAVSAANIHRSAAALLANSSVSGDPNLDLLTFSVTDSVPRVAEKLANAYGHQFAVYRHKLDTSALSLAIADTQRRLKAIRASGGTGSAVFLRLKASERDLEALQNLQAAGSSAIVVGWASSALQVQPKTKRNVILGLLVGIVLGLVVALLREALDTRVRSADELRERLGLPQLGQVPNLDGRAAGVEQLPTLSEPNGSVSEAFWMLKNKLEIASLNRDVGSIAVTSTTRGEGKSAAAANLAVSLARSGRHVVLLDLDLRRPSIDGLFSLSGRPGLTSVAVEIGLVDVLSADVLSRADVNTGRRTPNTGRLEVVTAGALPPHPGEFLSSSLVPNAFAELVARSDVLVIDTPPLLEAGHAMTIATGTDAVILVAGVNVVRRQSLAQACRVLEGWPTHKLGFIATTPIRTDVRGFYFGLMQRLSQYAKQGRRLGEGGKRRGAQQTAEGFVAATSQNPPERASGA